MEMTLQRLGLENYRPLLKGLVMPIGILALVAMMVLPLPVVLLDTFFVSPSVVAGADGRHQHAAPTGFFLLP